MNHVRSIVLPPLLLAAVFLVGTGCERRAVAPTSVEDLRVEEGPDQESWDVRFYISEDGMPRVHIEAAYMAKYERKDSTYMLLTGLADSLAGPRVRVYLFDAEGDSSATLVADRVLYFERDRRFEARGNVVVDTNEDRHLESEHLLWFEMERKVRTPGFVRIRTPSERIQGYNLEADENLVNYELRDVTGLVTVEEE